VGLFVVYEEVGFGFSFFKPWRFQKPPRFFSFKEFPNIYNYQYQKIPPRNTLNPKNSNVYRKWNS
jgi:hypothetical protein